MASVFDRAVFKLSAILAFALGVFLIAPESHANPAAGNFPLISVGELPPEARDTLKLIQRGGPFPYSRDGVVFSNREKILPREPRGYYHEYTVKTPGAKNRGALRIVCGGGERLTCYYSDDHYQTFRKIKE